MFENSNKEVIREIARESMKSHRLRNLTAVLGIGLTTLLITTICTAGISFYNAINLGTDLTPCLLYTSCVVSMLSAGRRFCFL